MNETGFDLLELAAIGWIFFVTVFWMITGYKAMKAHERIAAALEKGAGPRV